MRLLWLLKVTVRIIHSTEVKRAVSICRCFSRIGVSSMSAHQRTVLVGFDGAIITRAPSTAQCSFGTASSQRANWNDNWDATTRLTRDSGEGSLRFCEYHDPA